MLNELRSLIQESNVPDSVKLSLSVLVKALAWFPWVFVGVGILLNKEFFIYLLAFFLFIEGLLFVALIYLLLMIVRMGMPATTSPEPEGGRTAKSNKPGWGEDILKHVLGHAAFYIFILVVFIIAKGMGAFDELWKAVLRQVSGGA